MPLVVRDLAWRLERSVGGTMHKARLAYRKVREHAPTPVEAPFYYKQKDIDQTLRDKGGEWYRHAVDDQELWTEQDIFFFKARPSVTLWVINFVALLGHLFIAVAVVVEGAPHYENLDFPLFNIEARWHNTSASGFTYTIGHSEFGKLNLVVVCGLFSGLSALAHLVIVGTTWHPTLGMWYWRGLGRCCMYWRWIEYSLSAPLMAVALLLIGGVREVTIMFLVFFGQATCMTCGYLVEKAAVPDYVNEDWVPKSPSTRLAPFWTGCLAMFPAWIAFLYAFHSNVARQGERHNVEPPSWVYSIIYGQVGLFSSFTVPILWYQLEEPKHYWRCELWYATLSLIAKLVLNGTLLSRVFLTGRLDLSSDDFVRDIGSG